MSDVFAKHNMQLGKFTVALHHFTGPDLGDPHDHPFGFTTTILAGGYLERIWWRASTGSRRWRNTVVLRKPGTSHTVAAEDIHQIIELPEGECVTSVVWHGAFSIRRQPRFWRFGPSGEWAESRQWDESNWVRQAVDGG